MTRKKDDPEDGTTILMKAAECTDEEPEQGFESLELKISSDGNEYWIHEIREFWFADEGKQVITKKLIHTGVRSLHPEDKKP